MWLMSGTSACVSVRVCVKGLTRSVWLHGDSGRGVREQVDGVPRCALLLEGVPLEINTVDVHLSAQPKGVPRYFVPGTHVQSEKVPVHTSIYS